MAIARIFLDCNLHEGAIHVLSSDQSHYLAHVLRHKVGDKLIVFSEESGEFEAEIIDIKKKAVTISIGTMRRAPMPLPDLWLCFAPVKKNQTDLIVEKATELGVARIIPILTHYTNSERVRTDRLKKIAIEAAEQCEALAIPRIDEPVKLDACLQNFVKTRQIIFCDERSESGSGLNLLSNLKAKPSAIFIGPEGGFSPEERGVFLEKNALQLSLGPRILRAETAALAAITLWQVFAGDWGDARK